MDDRSVFYHAIESVLNNWAALQLAVQHSMGGIKSEEKARWLVGALEQWIVENDGLDQSEVEDYLIDFLNSQFDTIADDGSVSEVASKFCTFYRLFRDDQQELTRVLNSLPKLTTPATGQSVPAESVATLVSSHQSASNELERTSVPEGMDVDMDEEGWQTINRNRRKTAK